MTKHPKVVIIGAGSLFFGRKAIWQMINSPYLNNGTLALVDTNPQTLDKMATLAKKVIEEEKSSLTLEASVDRRDVLKDADFVVLSFAEKSVYYRGIDCQISEKYGIRMCSGDTIGPGGIFRAMRELPVIMDCARDISELCPDAWVINYINPTTVNGIGLKKYAPHLKSFALCDAQHMPHIKMNYAVRAGITQKKNDYTDEIDRDFNFKVAGINHFTWIIKAEYKGVDLTPQIGESIRIESAKETEGGDTGAKAIYNTTIGYELYKIFGYVPTVVGHTKEYVNFWQGKGILKDKIPPLSIWETEERYARHREMFDEVDSFISGKTPISDFMTTYKADHATDIIEAMVSDSKKPYFVNTPNNGAVTNMADDAFFELMCTIDKNGPTPLPVGEMPVGLKGMQQIVLDTHELTAAAICEGSYELLRRAMMLDPLVSSVADADAIIKELLEAEKDIIPARWYK